MDRQVLGRWLKAGFLEKHAWFATTEGTPQGGIVSPALANWTLDGLQRLLADHFARTPKQQRMNKVHLVRYADDFLITGTSKELLRDQVQPLVAHFLKERGLELSHEKTRITHVEEGFDFLGQNVRRYRNGKVLTKPSSQSVKTFLSKIQETIDSSGSLTAGEMIQRLNQQIKGWTMYHRYAASKRTFTYVDHRIFQMVWRWCRRRHPKKSRRWIRTTYFPPDGHRHWVFTGMLREPERPRPADPVDGRSQGEDHSLCEDPERRQSLRSEVGTVPGGTVGLATDPDAGRSQSDRISLEETRGTMSGLWSTPADSRGRLSDPPSNLAQPRRSGHGGQHGVVPCQLSSADPRARRTDEAAASREGRL